MHSKENSAADILRLVPSGIDLGAERVVCMCGVSGSGKTFMARKLEALGFRRLSVDAYIAGRYGEEFGALPFGEQKKIFAEANTHIETLVAEALRRSERVVVDTTMCRRDKRDGMRAVCAAQAVSPLFIYLDVPFEVLRVRIARRRGTGPDDQRVPEERLRGFFMNFDRPAPDEPRIVTIN